MVNATILCEHCKSVAQRPVAAVIDGRELYFCCKGCLEIYRTLHVSGVQLQAPASVDLGERPMKDEKASS